MARREYYQRTFGTFEGPKRLVESNFPFFKDADTLIVITGARQFKLHSGILSNNSTYFKHALAEDKGAKLSKQAIRKGVTIKYRFELVKPGFSIDNSHLEDYEIDEVTGPALDYSLNAVELDEDGKPVHGGGIPLDLENGRVVPPEILAWSNVLGAFYNRPIDIGDYEESGLHDLLVASSEVLKIAEQLDCVHMITKPIEATLLATGQNLQNTICEQPHLWLGFAERIKSKILFREALIHSAGRYAFPEIQEALRNGTIKNKRTVETLEAKYEMLKRNSRAVQNLILSHYPNHLMREKTLGRADKDSIGRASYSNDILGWIGLNVFRHWVSQMASQDKTHHAMDIGYQFMKTVEQGGDAYLGKGQMAQFHNYFPMSAKGEGCVENVVSDLKEHCKTFVVDILKNNSQLDTRTKKISHFTCTKVHLEDYPWLYKKLLKQTQEALGYGDEYFPGGIDNDNYPLTEKSEDGYEDDYVVDMD